MAFIYPFLAYNESCKMRCKYMKQNEKNNAKSQIGNTFDEVMKKSTKYHMKRIEYSLFTF